VKRFLLLALLLDKVAASAAAVRAPVPLLFRVDAAIKSSAEVRLWSCWVRGVVVGC